MAIKYKIVPYVRVDVEDPELFDTLSEALTEKRHCQALQPEDHYDIEEVEVADKK